MGYRRTLVLRRRLLLRAVLGAVVAFVSCARASVTKELTLLQRFSYSFSFHGIGKTINDDDAAAQRSHQQREAVVLGCGALVVAASSRRTSLRLGDLPD